MKGNAGFQDKLGKSNDLEYHNVLFVCMNYDIPIEKTSRADAFYGMTCVPKLHVRRYAYLSMY